MKIFLTLMLIFILKIALAQNPGTQPVIPVEQPQDKHPTKKNIVKRPITPGKTTRSISITNIPMVYVEGGSFNMGSNDDGDDAKPIHRVTVSSFYIGKYEVSQGEWRAVMGNNPSSFQNCDDCPVEDVSWNKAQAFIEKLNQKTGKHYRLPTEAEWEYAARGGNKSNGYVYSGSNTISDVAWFSDNSGDKTHPVGQKQPNELGVYDMSGNVWEWCQDWYDFSYYANSPSENPQGPSTGSHRVHRGGSWDYAARHCRVAYRNNFYPVDGIYSLGFRLVLVP